MLQSNHEKQHARPLDYALKHHQKPQLHWQKPKSGLQVLSKSTIFSKSHHSPPFDYTERLLSIQLPISVFRALPAYLSHAQPLPSTSNILLLRPSNL